MWAMIMKRLSRKTLHSLASDRNRTVHHRFGACFMVFVLLYFPCIATLAAIRRETGSWKYAAFSIIYNTALAWIFAFITFNIVIMFT